jgi:hypothetical protein
MAEWARAAADWGEVDALQLLGYGTLLAWREGRLAEAEAGLRALADNPIVSQRYAALHHLGAFLVSQGRDAEAITVIESAQAIGWFRGTADSYPWLHPESLLLLATAHERLGDHPKALARVDELLGMLDRADPDLPRLAKARALRQRLAPTQDGGRQR